MSLHSRTLQSSKKKLFRVGNAALLLTVACGTTEPNDGNPVDASGGATSGDGGSGGATSGGTDSGGAASSGGTDSSGSSGGADSSSGGSTSSEACHKASDAGYLTTRLPCLLSETGLFQQDMQTLADGVHPFQPAFPLWTDSAEKRRWITLPAATKIDTTEQDYWVFPAGTKLWKEFSRDNVRVETRLIEKQESGAWFMVAYQWRSDLSDADAVPNGVIDASGTDHDIPDSDMCMKCHGQQPDKVLGFSAIQLSAELENASDTNAWNLDRLIAADLLSAPPTEPISVPGTEVERAFFGYVHANCGHCHNPRGAANMQNGLDLWLKVADLALPVTEFSVYQGIVNQDIVWLDSGRPAATKRIAAGSLEDSAIYQRFLTKGETWSMPQLGSELTDPSGKQIMEDWILSLD